eukprot:scaffold26942_cov27-Tisochrysis_lutea.AAC.2
MLAPTPANQNLRTALHACRLKGVDIEFMRRLQPYVNLIPVIAKADTMTVAERDAFRRLILSELKAKGVKIFELEAPKVVLH